MTATATTYQRLEESAYLIARHPEYFGKGDVVRNCMDEIEDRYRQGSLTLMQSTRLIAILLGEDVPVGDALIEVD